MQQIGVKGAHATPGSRDGGIDVEARRAIAQVKWTSAQVGRADLQRLCGADRGAKGRNRRLVFFAKTGYSPEAVKYASEAKIFLFTFTLKGKVEARNERARKLLKGDTRKFRVRDFSKYTEDRAGKVKNAPATAVDIAIAATAVLALLALLTGGGYLLVRGLAGLTDATPSAVLTAAAGLVLVIIAALGGRALWRLGAEC
ncbi:restriction endonuclease [Gordonia sp. zg691]|nr:restriction endonuclease [Gordonia jinghuaiqii]